VTDANRFPGGTHVDESFSASTAFAGTPAPSDAFEWGFSQSRLYRDTGEPISQSRPWLLWFLVVALSGGIAATVFWSDMSISRDGAPQAVGSDSAWRGVIRQPRPDRSVPAPKLVQAAKAANDKPISMGKLAAIKPRRQLAAYSAAAEKVPAKTPLRSESPVQSPSDLLGDPTVLSIQGLLSKNGFDPGPVDGLMGKRTQTAILAWQLQVGLPTTGSPSKRVLEQLLDPAKATGDADRLPIGDLVRLERDTLEAWCTTGRAAAKSVAYFKCMGDEAAKMKSGVRMPEPGNEASGNFDAFATARLLCTDQTGAAPQTYFKCLHAKLGRNKPLLVME